jgi:hypothetical protein
MFAMKKPKNGVCKMCKTYSVNCYRCDAAICDNNHVVASSKTIGDCENHLVVTAIKKWGFTEKYTADYPRQIAINRHFPEVCKITYCRYM